MRFGKRMSNRSGVNGVPMRLLTDSFGFFVSSSGPGPLLVSPNIYLWMGIGLGFIIFSFFCIHIYSISISSPHFLIKQIFWSRKGVEYYPHPTAWKDPLCARMQRWKLSVVIVALHTVCRPQSSLFVLYIFENIKYFIFLVAVWCIESILLIKIHSAPFYCLEKGARPVEIALKSKRKKKKTPKKIVVSSLHRDLQCPCANKNIKADNSETMLSPLLGSCLWIVGGFIYLFAHIIITNQISVKSGGRDLPVHWPFFTIKCISRKVLESVVMVIPYSYKIWCRDHSRNTIYRSPISHLHSVQSHH